VRRSTIFEFLDRRPVLNGEKVKLRPRSLDDCANEYKWRTDEELCRLDAALRLDLSPADFRERYSAELEYPGLTYTLAIDTLEGIHIGVCSLFNLDFLKGAAETGILIGEKTYWGTGHGADALRLLLKYVFEISSMEIIMLRTLDWNRRAQRCFEKCGFVPYSSLIKGDYNFVLMRIERQQAPAVNGQRSETGQ
jgi:RimJ/RimL family protein N-acetyltransferase